MKKYPNLYDLENRRKMQQQLEELRLFQEILRSSEEMNVHYHGKAFEIADGLNPWIDALRLQLKD